LIVKQWTTAPLEYVDDPFGRLVDWAGLFLLDLFPHSAGFGKSHLSNSPACCVGEHHRRGLPIS
jgi:hypothetical protein